MAQDSPLTDYLGVITGRGQGSGWIELRYRHHGGMRTRFYRADRDLRLLQRRVVALGVNRDVYVGCALRQVRRGDRAHVGQAWCLWAECDAPDALGTLDDFIVSPSFVVSSGTPGHVHAYWTLAEPVDADTLEDANRRLAAAVGGDPVCFDAARILRPPGTLNHKHSPPQPVRQLAPASEAPLSVSEILEHLPVADVPVSAAATSRDSGDDPMLAISPAIYVAELTGRPVGRDAKVSCPFHTDRTPSLHAYPTAEQGWFCFGCRRGGSIYDLAAELWGLETRGEDFATLRSRLRKRFPSDAT